jgi:KDO2-lipid IV(A) lauroyltransferase
MLGEGLHLARAGVPELLSHVEFEGWETFDRLRAEGRRILVLSGHCGNWEMMTTGIPSRGLPLVVVARELQDSVLDELLVGLRARFGTETIHRGAAGAGRRLLAVLRGGGALGMLIDQDIRADSVFVPFFGRPAHTPVGAAQLALRHGLTVVPAFIERRDDGSHLMRVLPPLELPADPVAATATMTAAIEAQVRRRPEQWVWMHRRWRRQPPTAAAADTGDRA